MEDKEKKQPVVLCNTSVAQNDGGKLDVFVNGVLMVGVVSSQITSEGALIIALPSHAYRMVARHDDKRPVYETKDNVIHVGFPLMAEYRRKWEEQEKEKAADEPPPTDGNAS